MITISGNECSHEAKIDPVAPLHRLGGLSIAQRSHGIDMTRLCLYIC